MEGNLFEYDSKWGIFKDRYYLKSNVIPEELPHRHEEIDYLVYHFRMLLSNVAPPHMLILGTSGTGKTATVSRVVKDLREMIQNKELRARVGYTVAKDSEFSTLVSLARDMGLDPPKRGYSLDDVIEYVLSVEEPMMMIIDEIDGLILSGKYKKLLYFLTRTPNISLIGISNRQNLMSNVKDQKINSSWNPRKKLFEKYTADQLADIIRNRVYRAFNEDTVSEEIINYIAAKSAKMGGDARYALDLLMYSGDVAEREGKRRVEQSDVRKGEMEAEKQFIYHCVRKLPIYHKILLTVVTVNESIQPSKAYSLCNKALGIIGKDGKSNRRWSDFRSELELGGFISYESTGRGRGKGWRYSLVSPEENDRQTTLNILMKELKRYTEDVVSMVRSLKYNNGR